MEIPKINTLVVPYRVLEIPPTYPTHPSGAYTTNTMSRKDDTQNLGVVIEFYTKPEERKRTDEDGESDAIDIIYVFIGTIKESSILCCRKCWHLNIIGNITPQGWNSQMKFIILMIYYNT